MRPLTRRNAIDLLAFTPAALLVMTFMVMGLVDWTVRREDKACTIAAEPSDLAARLVRAS